MTITPDDEAMALQSQITNVGYSLITVSKSSKAGDPAVLREIYERLRKAEYDLRAHLAPTTPVVESSGTWATRRGMGACTAFETHTHTHTHKRTNTHTHTHAHRRKIRGRAVCAARGASRAQYLPTHHQNVPAWREEAEPRKQGGRPVGVGGDGGSIGKHVI
jgi:hypothetical protein